MHMYMHLCMHVLFPPDGVVILVLGWGNGFRGFVLWGL